MWIELPWVETVRWVRCPACRDRIGVHLIRDEFTCPHCSTVLRASPGRALLVAILVGVALITLGSFSLSAWVPSAFLLVLSLLGAAALAYVLVFVAWRSALGLGVD